MDVLQVPARGPPGAVRHRGRRDERLAPRRRPRRGAARRWAGCCTVEGDAWFLPDTGGVAYGTDHVKTTIVPAAHRPGRPAARLLPQRRATSSSRATTSTACFRLGAHDDPDRAAALRRAHPPRPGPARRPRPGRAGRGAHPGPPGPPAHGQPGDPHGGPARATTCRGWPPRTSRPSTSTRSALCRQCGASAELAASFVDWLDRHDGPGTEAAAEPFRAVAEGAKRLQFAMARRGRAVGTSTSTACSTAWRTTGTTPWRCWSPLWGLTTAGRPAGHGAVWWCVVHRPAPGRAPRIWRARACAGCPPTVPGTVGGRAAGPWGRSTRRPDRLDGQDWWYRCRFAGPRRPGCGRVGPRLEGLATLADVWLERPAPPPLRVDVRRPPAARGRARGRQRAVHALRGAQPGPGRSDGPGRGGRSGVCPVRTCAGSGPRCSAARRAGR